MIRHVLATAAAGICVALCACGSTSTDPVAALIATFDKADFADCQAQRDQVARYLLAGSPRSLDATYLVERTNVLKQPQGVQAAYIRQYVNQLTAQCDQAEQTARQAALDQKLFPAACTKLGGTVASTSGGGPTRDVHNPKVFWLADAYQPGDCIITYYVQEIGMNLIYALPLAPDGSIDRAKYNNNFDVRCAGHPEDFHDDTGVCVVVGWID